MNLAAVPSRGKTKDIAFIVIVAVGIILGFIVIKKVLEGLGLFEDPDKKKARLAAEAAKKRAGDLILSKEDPTYNDAQLKNIADNIYNDLKFSAVSDDKTDAVRQLKSIHNNADFVLVDRYFGLKQEYFFGIPTGGEQSLSQFVSSNLSTSQLNDVNNYYNSVRITFRF